MRIAFPPSPFALQPSSNESDTIPLVFQEFVRRTPNKLAVSDRDTHLTYRALETWALSVARTIQREMGMPHPPRPVGLTFDTTARGAIGMLGVLMSGHFFCPLATSDPLERIQTYIRDAQLELVLASRESVPRGLDGRVPVIFIEDIPRVSNRPVSPPRSLGNSLAALLYTSGSTGTPKGVAQTHSGLLSAVFRKTASLGIDQNARVANISAFTFGGYPFNLFAGILSGATVHFYDFYKHSLHGFSKWLLGNRITHIHWSPTALRHFLQTLESKTSFSDLRVMSLGGEPVLPSDVYRFDELIAEPTKLCTSGALLETWFFAETFLARPFPPGISKIPMGYLHKECSIAFDEGQKGEMLIHTPSLSTGYWGRPDLTEEKYFRANDGVRYFRSGDIGTVAENGLIYHEGRNDSQVKIRGIRVELDEIENALLQIPNIKEAAVIAINENSENPVEIAAYVVAERIEKKQILDVLRGQLPMFMIPQYVTFLDALPLTRTYKINRNRLPVPSRTENTAMVPPPSLPKTDTEVQIHEIWSQVLQRRAFGIMEGFLELGGSSLLAVMVQNRIIEVFGIDVPLDRLFGTGTVRELAALVDGLHASQAPMTVSMARVPRAGDLPLSFSQQRLWFLDQLEPNSSLYNMPQAVRLSGPFDAIAMAHSLGEIVRRHEALRTTFADRRGEPIQQITSSVAQVLRLVELDEVPALKRDVETRRLARTEALCPFDLFRGPLFRFTVLRLGEQDHVLLITLHHIVSDGWSIGILNRELKLLYEAFSEGRPSPLPELDIQYADFAVLQRQWLQGELLARHLAYWRQQLEGAPRLLELATDWPRPRMQIHQGGQQYLVLSSELSQELRALSRRESVTLFMTLLAAFQLLLHRYTGQEDIVVGSPIAGRNRAETEELIGFFLNSVALRTDLSGNPTFRELLGRVREVTLDAYTHQDIPFERVLDDLKSERDLSHTPLFQVFLNMLNIPETRLELPGLSVEPMPTAEIGSTFDLTLYVSDDGAVIQLRLSYQVALFSETRMTQLLEHYHTVLNNVVIDPGKPLSQLPLLSKGWRSKRPAQYPYPQNVFTEFGKQEIEQSIVDRFEQQVARYGKKKAVSTARFTWTYESLNQRANQIAHAIIAREVPGLERVLLLCEHDVPMIAAMLGVLKAGKAYVPVSAFQPKERINRLLQDSQCALVLADNANHGLARELSDGYCQLIDVESRELPDKLDNPGQSVSPYTIAYMLYTSGSTGKPKGVAQNHRNVLHHTRQYTNKLHIAEEDRLTLLSAYSFDASVMDIYGALLNGATLYPLDLTRHLPSLPTWLEDQRITIYHSTPTVYRELIRMAGESQVFENVRLVVLGGEEVYWRDVASFKQHFSQDSILVNGLGPTESTLALQYLMGHETEIMGSRVPVGYPVGETEIVLLDRNGAEADFYGEIGIRSSHTAIEYWGQPELTAERFLEDPDGGDRRVYRTGDMGRFRPDGAVEFCGRLDGQVKVRGFRVELGEVATVLSQHPAVRQAIVQTSEHVAEEMEPGTLNPETQGDEQLVGYVVPAQGVTPQAGELRVFLEDKLPDYMVPASFVLLDELPLTPNGKLDRRRLPKAKGIPPELAGARVAPRTPTEEILAKIWQEVLRRQELGVFDNFFDLGGDSLLATRVINRLPGTLPVNLTLRDMFETPTIAGLADRVELFTALLRKPDSRAVSPHC